MPNSQNMCYHSIEKKQFKAIIYCKFMQVRICIYFSGTLVYRSTAYI